MISHFVPAVSPKEIDEAFDKLSSEVRARYYRFRYAPPMSKSLTIQTLQVIRDGEVVFTLDLRSGDLQLADLLTMTGKGGVEEVAINSEMVYLRVSGIVLLNRFA